MIGQEVRVGTGTFDLILDRQKHETLSKQCHQPRRQHMRVQRRKQAIADRMAEIDRIFPHTAGTTAATANTNIDPMSLREYDGSGFGFGGTDSPFRLDRDEEEYDPGAPLYSPSPTYSPAASPRYSPTTSPRYSPASPQYSKNSNNPPSIQYSPPASPQYSKNSNIYDPMLPGMTIERVSDQPYDPERLDLWKDNNDDDDDVGF